MTHRFDRGDRGRALAVNGSIALSVWLGWLVWGGQTAVDGIRDHWPVTVTMVFGSLIAGATSEGGGAVAFPVFTKLLDIPPHEARVFALAIQSVGMTAATVAILVLRVRVAWSVVLWAGLGGLVGIVVGTFWLVPLASASVVRVAFTTMIASLGVALVLLNGQRRSARHPALPRAGRREAGVLVLTGVAGGIMSGLVGSGIDIVTFMTMVLLFRLDEKVATPTSVVLMSTNALCGFALHGFALDTFTPTVQSYWLAAVPVVVVGAPLGAYLCSITPRHTIARVLIGLIVLEVVSTAIVVPMSPQLAATALLTFFVCSLVHGAMCRTTIYRPRHAAPQR